MFGKIGAKCRFVVHIVDRGNIDKDIEEINRSEKLSDRNKVGIVRDLTGNLEKEKTVLLSLYF